MHLSYSISEINSKKHNRTRELADKEHENTIENLLDFIICIDMAMNFLTSYQTEDGIWDLYIPRVIWNYIKGTMFLDMMGTFPCLVSH